MSLLDFISECSLFSQTQRLFDCRSDAGQRQNCVDTYWVRWRWGQYHAVFTFTRKRLQSWRWQHRLTCRMQYRWAIISGVTRVGVTRGGNWWCHPYFSWNTDDLVHLVLRFSQRLWKVMTFFSCRLLTTPVFPRRLSSVLSKLAIKKSFYSGVTPWMVLPAGPPSASL